MKGESSFGFGSYEMAKVIKGLLIAVGGSILAYLLSDVIPIAKDMFAGTPYLVLVPLMSTIINAILQFLKNNETR